MRQKKREVRIGNVTIGGSNPIAVQTMLNVPVEDIEGNVAQAKRCEAAGCQILRVTCPSPADARCIEAVKNAVSIPIVADIHFDYKAALACADVGVDKIRINPGNIGDDSRVKAVVDACQRKNIPIRIGVNGGSLEKHILAKYGAPTPEAMVESALYHVRLLEKFDFNNIVISIKNSNVPRMMEAYRQLSAVTDYPLHVGVTEAGTYQMGLLKSGMGIGGMLLEGIGDTIRVSLAAEPEKEVEAGYNILRAVGFPVARFVNRETVKTNVDGLIGRKAKVIKKIDNNEPSGAAVIDGQEWTARSADEAVTIPVGTHVVIKEVRGVKLIVEMIPETENRN